MSARDDIAGRLGYVRADSEVVYPEPLERNGQRVGHLPVEPMYPQVIVIQGRSNGESWVRDHAGQLLLAFGVGVFALTALAVIALVVIVAAVALVVCGVGLAVLGVSAASGFGGGSSRGRRR